MTTTCNSHCRQIVPRSLLIAGASFLAFAYLPVIDTVVLAQNDEASTPESTNETPPASRNTESGQDSRQTRDQRGPRLGIMIAPSPGGSPLVLRVQPGSPADRAGLHHGDFILSVGDEKIDSLEELQQAIADRGDGDTMNVTTWRAGEERVVTISFAPRERSARQEALESHPWLGILVGQSDQRGAEISRVYVGGPADKAGLRTGDRVLRVDGQSVATPESVANYVKSIDIGKDIELVIEREGKEQTIAVTVGNLEDFHERLFGERFRSKFDDYHQMYDPDFDGVPDQLFGVEAEDVRTLLGELMEELKELREEVRQSKRDRDPTTNANIDVDEISTDEAS